jgi:ATP-dependent DNA helicase RecQ
VAVFAILNLRFRHVIVVVKTMTSEGFSTLDLLAALRAHFRHQTFRAGQQEVVTAVLSGRDVLAVMPTGSGKSLGYQLPAMMLPGTTLVVSPLISLMKDQVDELARRGIPAAALHSMMPPSSRQEAIAAARRGRLRLLYVAPERLASSEFFRLLADVAISRFVIDEAHCVSEWGHDFRPDYRRLRDAASRCRTGGAGARPPMAAFTATATPEVRADVVTLLGLLSPQVLVAGFDRPNIRLRLEPIAGEEAKHERLPALVRGRRALVYAATRKTAEAAAQTLSRAAIDAAVYHAGLKDDERTRVQEAFANGSLGVVCATNAFGMGIDRQDVDAVVHFAIPGSLEAYYQEVGRAGRDGRPATATLLWDEADVATRRFLIDGPRRESSTWRRPSVDPAELARRKEIEHRRLREMIAYARAPGCLRAAILRHFGDPAALDRCAACGNCDPLALDAYELTLVRKILAGVARAGERYGRHRIAAMLAGQTADLPAALASLPTAGLLRHEPQDAIGQWIDCAAAANLLTFSADRYRTLSLTPLGREVMSGRATLLRMATPRRVVAQLTPEYDDRIHYGNRWERIRRRTW